MLQRVRCFTRFLYCTSRNMSEVTNTANIGKQKKEFSAEERANFQRMSYSERKAFNKKRRKEKKLQRKLDYLDRMEQAETFVHAGSLLSHLLPVPHRSYR